MAILFLGSCGRTDCREAPRPDQMVDITIKRQELDLFRAKEINEVVTFLQNHPVLRDHFFYAGEYPDVNVLASKIYSIVGDEHIDTLYQEAIGSYDARAQEFEHLLETSFSNLKTYYPERKIPEIHTIVSGLYNDLYISDSVIIVGIDYFIGEEATYRPNDIPEYILKRYNYDYLVPTMMKFVVRDLPSYGVENTLLSEMIDYGKVYYLLSMLLPCTSDHRIIGFTAEEMEDVNANQEVIWASLIENEALYETSEFMKTKFLSERPNVYEIGEKCPGRIGAWVGWQIVKSYVENKSISVPELLAITNHHELFSQSGYKPGNIK